MHISFFLLICSLICVFFYSSFYSLIYSNIVSPQVCSEQHHDSQDERRGGFVDFKDLLQDDDTIARDEGQDDGQKPGR